MLKLGFIGVGTISSAVVHGLMAADRERYEIVLSPRNVEASAALASRYKQVTVAASNQDVIDRSETVILAVRPQVALNALQGLTFRSDQGIVSLIASLSIDQLRDIVSPAQNVMLAAPLPMVEFRMGATVVFPDNPITRSIFDALGKAVPASTPTEFNVFVATTAMMGSYFGLLEAIVHWMRAHGVHDNSAKQYLSQMFFGLGSVVNARHDCDMSHLRTEFSTVGGLNEQLYETLDKDGVFVSLSNALDVIYNRVTRKTDEQRRVEGEVCGRPAERSR